MATILLAAGGTGGHLFPALATREALVRRGHAVAVATDPRVGEWVAGVPAADIHRIRSGTPSVRSPAAFLRALKELSLGYLDARALVRRLDPAVVVGFGGYPTVPPLLAARGRSRLVHEQNAVIGRANRFLVKGGAALATSFPNVKGAEIAPAVTLTGNPVRDAVKRAAAMPYQPPGLGGPIRLLVFGGSQGARAFSTRVPDAIERLPIDLRRRLVVAHQARPEDLAETETRYRALGVEAEVRSFFADLPERIGAAHLVVSRAGASTVCELAAIGRPAVLVPYPHALDHDQAANAEALVKAGGGVLLRESDMTSERLAAIFADWLGHPDRLQAAAGNARSAGRLDAAERLADLIETMAGVAR